MKTNALLKSLALASALSLLAACGKNEEADTESASAEPAPAATAGTASDGPVVAETADQKLSYAIGFQMASRYQADTVLAFDKELFSRGIEDAFSGRDMAVAESEAQAAGQELQARAQAQQAEEAEKGQAAGKAFLAENKDKPGVTTTASGLQYEVLEEGDGEESPTATDTVEVHYHGTLTDGTVFDSSVDRGDPISFPLNGVIPGWTEGVQLMTVGDKYRFFIPSDLAYGPSGQGSIPPHSTLIFDVELLGIEEK